MARPDTGALADHHLTISDLLSRHTRLSHEEDTHAEVTSPVAPPAVEGNLAPESPARNDGDDALSPPATSPQRHESARRSLAGTGTPGHASMRQEIAVQAPDYYHGASTFMPSNPNQEPNPGPRPPPHEAAPDPAVPQDEVSMPLQSWDVPLVDDLDLLWAGFAEHSSLVMPSSFSHNYPMNFLALPGEGFPELGHASLVADAITGPPSSFQHVDNVTRHQEDHPHRSGDAIMHDVADALPRRESRLPSPQHADHDEDLHHPHHTLVPELASEATAADVASGRALRPAHTGQGSRKPWSLSNREYQAISSAVQSHDDVLPKNFVFPSRHALCRYVEGYFSGFHEHLPFIHLPSFCISEEAPELIMAIAAIGAQYRFQREQAYRLYIAARALLELQLRCRDGYDTPRSVFSASALDAEGRLVFGQSPSEPDQSANVGQTMPSTTTRANTLGGHDPRGRDTPTMQAMIILIAMGTWNHRSLLKDAFSTASQLAMIVREDNQLFPGPDTNQPTLTWSEWIVREVRRRTKLVAFCFINLHCIAYDLPPRLLLSDIKDLLMPAPESHWRADGGAAWKHVRSTDSHVDTPLHASYTRLFAQNDAAISETPSSSFANYVLIHLVLYHIFFARQSLGHTATGAADVRASSLPQSPSFPLEPKTLAQFDAVLWKWQQNWEATKDSSLDPSAPGGPLSFNATALFRIAYIRLSADLGPSRRLESRDPMTIARMFRNAPLLERNSFVSRAVLQSAHALSIPVRIGIEFVARTQTLSWSIVHGLCNLECGLFVGKWLETVASVLESGSPLRDDEKRLLGVVSSIIDETDLGAQVRLEVEQARQVKRMASAVLRLWAYTFKGPQVFEIMSTISAGLDFCANILDQELEGHETG